MITRILMWTVIIALELPATMSAQQGEVRGVITDAETGNPLPGASALLTGTFLGAAADRYGVYRVEKVPIGTHTIEVRFIGYRTVSAEVTVTAGAKVELNFELFATALALDEVVVTGQAREVTRREIGSSMTTIDAVSLAEAPVTSMSQMLQARAPGVLVEQGGGIAGQRSKIILRGISSITMGIQPWIFVDGILVDNSNTPMGVWTGRIVWSSIDDINWSDVERVEILKGASAATLYGSAASAGVIQIFTKRSRDPRPITWTYRTTMGSNVVPKRQLRDMGVFADWFFEGSYRYTLNEYGETVRWTDPETGQYEWFEPIVRNGFYQQHNLSAQGTLSGFQYYTSLTYKNNQGPYTKNNMEELLSIRTNIQFLPRPDLVIRLHTGMMERKVQFPSDGISIYGFILNGFGGGPGGVWISTDECKKWEVVAQSRRFHISFHSEYIPVSSFTGRVTVGTDFVSHDNTEFIPWSVPMGWPLGRKTNYRGNTRTGTIDISGTLKTPLINETILSVLTLGFQGNENKIDANTAVGWDFPAPGLTTIEAAAVTEGWEYRRLKRFYGFYAQERIALYDILFLTAGFRGDRHSSFGKDYGWGLYPSAGISYVISEHAFWPIYLGELRLRTSFGKAGHPPEAFDMIRAWEAIAAVDGQPAVTTGQVGEPKLGPEVQTEYEIGFDWSVLKERINFDVTYYDNTTHDAILPVLSPPSEGFIKRQRRNVAVLKNRGWEISTGVNIFNKHNLRWNMNVNYSYNDNKIIDWTKEEADILPLFHVQKNIRGFPVVAYFGDRIIVDPEDGKLKMYSQSEEIKKKYTDPVTGEVVLPPGWDYIGPAFPVRNLQILSDFNLFRNVNINILFDHQGGHYIQSATFYLSLTRRIGIDDPIFPDKAGWPVSAVGWEVWEDLEALKEKYPDTWVTMLSDPESYTTYFRNPVYAAFTIGLPFGRPFANSVTKADFLRLREFTVSYSVPSRFISGFGLRNASIYFTGRNLWISHNSMSMDPETNHDGTNDYTKWEFGCMPLIKQYYFGMQITF